ncbi:MAG: AtpZ/AtpI family protein [Lachnospiraceae bacterium]|nr:AtpZ/AtpI family protein [Lachnospiraceae bacterium]
MKFNRNVYQALSLIGQFGINMLVPVFICSFVGIFLDKKFGTSFCVVILFFVGALAGGMNVFRFAGKILCKDSEQSAYLHGSRRSKKDEGKDHED